MVPDVPFNGVPFFEQIISFGRGGGSLGRILDGGVLFQNLTLYCIKLDLISCAHKMSQISYAAFVWLLWRSCRLNYLDFYIAP